MRRRAITWAAVVALLALAAGAAARAAAPPAAALVGVRYPTTMRPLRAVDFVDPTVGWAAGANEVVIRSVTAGALWTRQLSVTSSYPVFTSICFVDKRNGWAVGTGPIVHTADGGGTWSSQTRPTSQPLLAVKFIDADQGWAVGGRPDDRPEATHQPTYVLLHTDDGGATWVNVMEGKGRVYFDVDFIDQDDGWIVGQVREQIDALHGRTVACVLRTSDGGHTWSEPLSGVSGLAGGSVSALRAVDFGTAELGWTVGSLGQGSARRGVLLRTGDGGQTWTRSLSQKFSVFTDVSFPSTTVGYAVGLAVAGSTRTRWIVKTANGGATWAGQLLPVPITWVPAIDFVSTTRGWIVADTVLHRGVVLRTVNGGASWVRVR
jgi:photosystem II stability/assembly factor-like uncharacterized protein